MVNAQEIHGGGYGRRFYKNTIKGLLETTNSCNDIMCEPS